MQIKIQKFVIARLVRLILLIRFIESPDVEIYRPAAIECQPSDGSGVPTGRKGLGKAFTSVMTAGNGTVSRKHTVVSSLNRH